MIEWTEGDLVRFEEGDPYAFDAAELRFRWRLGPLPEGWVALVTWPGHDLPAELCSGCGRLLGHGTLLDYRPLPPVSYEAAGWDGLLPPVSYEAAGWDGLARPIMRREEWRRFAVSYACPACVARDVRSRRRG